MNPATPPLFYFDRTIALMLSFCLLLVSCQEDKTSSNSPIAENTSAEKSLVVAQPQKTRSVSEDFKNYWYSGEAEISSFSLQQARYGELREGTAALIFVTEDFLPEQQVKADRQNPENISVLKLNATKNFTTGIYPYSIMTSTFDPVSLESHALKVTQSTQEWCGHVYTQLNNRTSFEIMGHSYFQNEADRQFSLNKVLLENEIWTQLRIDPKELPIGAIEMIPDFAYLRMKHVPIEPYKAIATRTDSSYRLEYPSINRELIIRYQNEFPFQIKGWEERFISGFGTNAKPMTTTATALKTIKSPYWSKNSNADSTLRSTLGLE